MNTCERHGRIRCGECAYVEELKDKIESLQQQVRMLQMEQEWISVEDRLPEVKGEYLVFYKYKENEDRVDIALFSRFGWHKAHAITHWQPLPEPPKE